MVYIVLEGIDGVGKSTVCRMLQEYGIDAVFTREPYDQSIKELKILDQTELAYRFAEDRYRHMRDIIIPAINAGKHVISDRSYISNLAYQMYGGIDEEWLKRIQPHNLVYPDIIILLTCDDHVACKRSRELYAERLFDIQQNYRRILEHIGNCYTIDTTDLPSNKIVYLINEYIQDYNYVNNV